nr:glycosyltransferase family 4 protein [uncultured Lichenicoccus sp.]
MRLAVFSLCSNQGIPQARLLLETLRQFLPAADRYLVLADERHPSVPYPDDCVVIPAEELGIPDFAGLAFRYRRAEFTAALKPFAFLHLLGTLGYTHCLYFDPDIELFSTLQTVTQALEANASFILTPYILQPAEDTNGPDDVAIMRGGTFNLGFLGVSGTREARDGLAWWARWLRTHCIDDRPIGLFIDQKFVDLIPGLAIGTRILRDPALNVAHWNLSQRRFVPDAPAGPEIDGEPLGFFHYSGFDPADPDRLSAETDQFRGAGLPGSWRMFLAGYADRLRAAGHGVVPAGCYAYGRFASGVPIPAIVRRMFLDDYPAWQGDPFETFEAWSQLPARDTVPGVGSAIPSLMMQWLHARDPRLVRLPLSDATNASYVTRWWIEQGPLTGIDHRFIEPQAEAAGRRAVAAGARFPPPHPEQADVTVIAPLGAAGSGVEPGLAIAIGQAQRVSLGRAAGRMEACDADRGEPDPVSGRVLGFCLAPDRLGQVLDAGRLRLPRSAYRIFIPSAERILLSPSCREALAGIDEVWAPTRFMQARIVLATDCPVLHMPVAWQFAAPVATSGEGAAWTGRPYVLADDDAFPGNGALRAGIAAYAAAFGSRAADRRPVLAVRSRAADEELQALVAENDGVLLPPAADPMALVAGAACLLALHRGEAVGLAVLQAMALGVPVVATEFGGCTDVLTPTTGYPVEYRLAPQAGDEGVETAWAEADPDHAVWSLRDLFDRSEIARRRADAARRAWRGLHDPAEVAIRQARRLDLVERMVARPSSLVGS